jgi:hypothetical protein
MTVTTNSLGSNSAEIIAVNETNLYTNVMTAIDAFVTTHGWSAKPGVGNDLEKVYISSNATGGGTKEIKINALDLHIQMADSFTGTTTITSTNEAERYLNLDHITYPDYAYAKVTSESRSTIGYSNTSNGNVTNYYYTTFSFFISAGQTNTLYPNQQIKVIDSNNTDNYCYARINSHNNTTGAISATFSLDSNTLWDFTTDTYICIDRLNYVTDIQSAHIFISASDKHIAIQCRNTNGVWHDFTAICETENPLAVEDASILTTGFMLGNSGMVIDAENWNEIDYQGSTNQYQPASQSPPNTVLYRNHHSYGERRQLTGPFSMSSTRKSRTGHMASIFNEISTPLGSAKLIGGQLRMHLDRVNKSQSTSSSYATYNYIETDFEQVAYFRGMGDVIPASFEPVTGKLWALSGTAICDLGNLTNTNNFYDNEENDNYLISDSYYTKNHDRNFYITTNLPSTTAIGSFESRIEPKQKHSIQTSEPTLLGRIYNMKFLTTGIYPSSIVSVDVDANGFTDTSGTPTDHLVFAVYSNYEPTTTITDDWKNYEDNNAIERIKSSQSVAIGFPK